MATNITRVESKVSRNSRAELLGASNAFNGCTIWFTGLSGAGKTTLAQAIEKELMCRKIPCYGLDGDNMRTGLNKNLGFSDADRCENIRRVAETSKLFADGGIVSLASFISPFEADRAVARQLHVDANLPFHVCHVATPLSECEARDPKSLYKRARAGEIKNFTGIDSPFEAPVNPEITVGANGETISQCVDIVLEYLEQQGTIPEKHPKIYELFVSDADKAAKTTEAASLPKLNIDELSMQWLQMLAEGWASPLKGFMREKEFLQVLHFGTLQDTCMPVAIVLPCDDKEKATIEGKDITLVYEGKDVAIMRNVEVFDAIKEERVARQFGVVNTGHPYIEKIYSYGDFLAGGEVEVLNPIVWNDDLDRFRIKPAALRQRFKDLKADAVFAFQLRNPVHNGHALLMQDTENKLKARGYKNPVLLLHPLGGWTKPDDVPLKVRMAQHECVLNENVLPKDRTVLAIWPSPMMYAGPTEVQWHARCRAVAGANFYIVGRDPAGMAHPVEDKNLYSAHHGTEVLQMAPGLASLEIIPFRFAAYNTQKKAMDFFDPAKKEIFESISGTKMRNFARTGTEPPVGFMCPSGWKVVSNYYMELAAAAAAAAEKK